MATVLGKVAELKCVVKGSAPLSVQWQKDEQWILEDPKMEKMFDGSVAILRIPVCESVHSGRYTCQAVNEAGQEKCFATLLVQGLCHCMNSWLSTTILHFNIYSIYHKWIHIYLLSINLSIVFMPFRAPTDY